MTYARTRIFLAAVTFSTAATPAAAQAPVTIAGVTAAPGATASGTLNIAARPGDQGTTVPFTVVNGKEAGPVLALVAGTHGMEYVPIVALQRMRTAIDPATLRGTVIMVHVANMPSYLGRTIYYSPVDGKNLNRVYPGKADGTISERIADARSRSASASATGAKASLLFVPKVSAAWRIAARRTWSSTALAALLRNDRLVWISLIVPPPAAGTGA